MALQFQPYPIPQDNEPAPIDRFADRAQQMLALANQYQMQKQQADLQQQAARADRASKIASIVDDYGPRAPSILKAAGLDVSGLSDIFNQPAPGVGPMQGAALPPVQGPMNAPMQGPMIPGPVAAAPAPNRRKQLLDINVEEVRRLQGNKAADKVAKEISTEKDKMDLELKAESLEKANRGKRYVPRDELNARPDRTLQPGEELMPLDPAESIARQSGMKLSGEFGRESNTFKEIASGAQRVLNASDNVTGDMRMIFGYMKMLDPTSIVRESEYATAENARGIPETVRNLYNKAVEGRRLAPDQRQRFRAEALSLYKDAEDRQSQLEQEYRRQAAGFGADPDQVIRDYKLKLPGGGESTKAPPTAVSGVSVGVERYQAALVASREALRVNPNDAKARRALEIAERKLAEAQSGL